MVWMEEGAVQVQPPVAGVARRFEGKVALVVGAASPVGRATAVRLATEGAAVACVDPEPEALGETVEALRILGGRATSLRSDPMDGESIGRAVDQVANELGRPSVLCVVPGTTGYAHTLDIGRVEWDGALAEGLRGPFLAIQATLPYLQHPQGGSVVVVLHAAGFGGSAYRAVDAAVHGGLLSLSRSLAAELAGRRVRVNAVAAELPDGGPEEPSLPVGADPRAVARSRGPFGPVPPDLVAAAVVFLASEDAAATSGAVLRVDGGQSL